MNPRTHIAARRFCARLQQRRAHQAMMAALTEKVLEKYAGEVRTACPEQLAHLAERAETLPDSPVCAEMRALVEAEQEHRRHHSAVTMHIHQSRCRSGCTDGISDSDVRRADAALQRGWNEVAYRMEKWAAADYDGDWRDARYDTPGPDGGAR